MRLIVDLLHGFRSGQLVWVCSCRQLKYKTMAKAKREALVLMAKRIVRIKNEELKEVF